jgi:hypothetical protein
MLEPTKPLFNRSWGFFPGVKWQGVKLASVLEYTSHVQNLKLKIMELTTNYITIYLSLWSEVLLQKLTQKYPS